MGMTKTLKEIVDLKRYKLDDDRFCTISKRTLDESGVLVLPEFLKPAAIAAIQAEGLENQHLAYYTSDKHNIYLTPSDPDYPESHPRNRKVSSSKGCITADQIPGDSLLHTLYAAPQFREYLCAVLGEYELHEYADSLSSINLHYASEGQELGWHYDNSSFAITLLIQKPVSGGDFNYVKDVRDADNGEMNYEQSAKVLEGEIRAEKLAMDPGALVLFRGRNSMHRVTPTEGNRTRMLAVLAYNSAPGISLSESARMTFYGRVS